MMASTSSPLPSGPEHLDRGDILAGVIRRLESLPPEEIPGAELIAVLQADQLPSLEFVLDNQDRIRTLLAELEKRSQAAKGMVNQLCSLPAAPLTMPPIGF